MSQKTFKNWIKENTSKTPSSALDELILAQARTKLNQKQKSWGVLFPASGMLAASVLIVFLTISNEKQKDELALNEPIELIQEFDEIELMAETSSWTDEDWKVALSGEET